jgi:hypothetical protein
VTQAQLVADLTNDAVVAAFFGAVFFVVSYSLTSRWWRHAIGTTLVMLDAGLILTLAPSVLHRLFGLGIAADLGFSWYFFCSITLVASGVWWRSFVMLRINWRDHRFSGRRNASGNLTAEQERTP